MSADSRRKPRGKKEGVHRDGNGDAFRDRPIRVVVEAEGDLGPREEERDNAEHNVDRIVPGARGAVGVELDVGPVSEADLDDAEHEDDESHDLEEVKVEKGLVRVGRRC